MTKKMLTKACVRGDVGKAGPFTKKPEIIWISALEQRKGQIIGNMMM